MARFTFLLLFAAALLAAASGETAYYVDGSVQGIAPHAQGTLVLTDLTNMTFRAGKTPFQVPYQSITKAELRVVRSKDNGAAYKVWRLPKRLRQSKTQYLAVSYRNEQDQAKTSILDLEPSLDPDDRRTGGTEDALFPKAHSGVALLCGSVCVSCG